ATNQFLDISTNISENDSASTFTAPDTAQINAQFCRHLANRRSGGHRGVRRDRSLLGLIRLWIWLRLCDRCSLLRFGLFCRWLRRGSRSTAGFGQRKNPLACADFVAVLYENL